MDGPAAGAVDPFGAELSRALSAGLPLWLPAAQSRAAAFAPGADVRGPRDLPVLIVAGPDLAAAVSRGSRRPGRLGDLGDPAG